MEISINNSDISILNQNNIINEKEKIVLPKIKKELIHYQNKEKINKLCQSEKSNYSRLKINNPVFLTSKKIVVEKSSYDPNNTLINLDKIRKLLKSKIEINSMDRDKNKFHYKTNKDLRSFNKLKSYINDASLYKNSIYIKREINRIKEMKVGRLFTLSNTSKKLNRVEKDNNRKTINLRIYKEEYGDKNNFRKLKILDKKNINNKISNYIQRRWRKNLNCALNYKFKKNKESIDEVTLKLKEIDNKVNDTFNKFKNETDYLFDEVIIIKDNKKKRKK